MTEETTETTENGHQDRPVEAAFDLVAHDQQLHGLAVYAAVERASSNSWPVGRPERATDVGATARW